MKKIISLLLFILLISTVGATTVTMDAASGPGTGFDNQFIFDYDYNDADVTVTFDEYDDNFVAHVIATGLKPSFTYQVKFEGQGSLSAYAATNELIGLNGRWWYNGNRDDTYYWANKDTYDIIGYMVFDYFTTDNNGDFDGYVETSASYHVLYCDDDLSGNGDLYPISNEPAYDGETLKCVDSTLALCPEESVYGQIQSGREGFSNIPEGIYEDVIFTLNEESFHVSCGTWTTAMTKEIDFEIVEDNVCGNNVYEPENNEECDNGEGGNRDNMQPVWNQEQGQGDRWYCSTDCVRYFVEGIWCGDGHVNGPEECDDGNNEDYDGCSSTCEIEDIDGYLINGNQEVIGTVTYPVCSEEGFFGNVDTEQITTGVKRHQMKLEGKPSCIYPSEEADDWANEQIGLQGRFWCTANCPCTINPSWGGCNIDDNNAYLAHKDDAGFCAQGYILFDCANTDAEGELHTSFDVDSSYATCSSYFGPTTLPDGNYNVRFILGQDYFPWGTVGTQDIEFTLGDCSQQNDIPEFSVIGAAVVLGLAGLFVYKKRH